MKYTYAELKSHQTHRASLKADRVLLHQRSGDNKAWGGGGGRPETASQPSNQTIISAAWFNFNSPWRQCCKHTNDTLRERPQSQFITKTVEFQCVGKILCIVCNNRHISPSVEEGRELNSMSTIAVHCCTEIRPYQSSASRDTGEHRGGGDIRLVNPFSG